MKVRELKKILAELDDNLTIYVSRDEEGNGFKELTIAELSDVVDQDGELVVCHPDDLEAGEYDGWDIEKAVVLWP